MEATAAEISAQPMSTSSSLFAGIPATVGIVHTHPNSSSAKPQDEDIIVANKFRVPIFTITNRGMFVYDPLPEDQQSNEQYRLAGVFEMEQGLIATGQ
jgi:hypothetical protein